MARYYMNENPQENGDHEVHKDGCDYMPSIFNRRFLGDFDNCHQALKVALEIDKDADGCYWCCRDCHNS